MSSRTVSLKSKLCLKSEAAGKLKPTDDLVHDYYSKASLFSDTKHTTKVAPALSISWQPRLWRLGSLCMPPHPTATAI